MSMISSQYDELREKAKLLRGHVDGLSSPYVIPSTKELMALTMLDSAGRMEQAADTILELRDDLQRANDAVQDAEHDESMAWERVRKAEAENESLREKYYEYESKMDDLVCKLTGGLLSKSATSLTNDALYSVVEELMTDELVDENFKLELENSKLRELVRDMWRFTGTACKKYPRLFDPSAQGGQMVQPNMIDAFEQRMNELRI